jgi:antibiotic biosynthesis monooxygenase (ABM) superfamily enzyme
MRNGRGNAEPRGGAVTIIIQTRVRPDAIDAFARWQDETSRAIARFRGFVKQTVLPPSPPRQVDWVILQQFVDEATATAWLKSDERQQRIREVAPLLVGVDDVHVVREGGHGPRPAAVSAVISSRIVPGQEPAYLCWEQRIAAAQARAPGFQGYRLERPIPGVQDDWVVILRFDTDTHLQGWLDSPERAALLAEASAFTQEYHTRIARTGFDQWFSGAEGPAARPAPWKGNMLVLAFLYPLVFLFGAWVQTPWLERAGLPFWLALFISLVVTTLPLNYLVPWASRRLAWWLNPPAAPTLRTNLAGAALLAALYVLSLLVFSRFP